jgi:hypothetical protein
MRLLICPIKLLRFVLSQERRRSTVLETEMTRLATTSPE